MFCKNCGHPMREEDRFCPECGTAVPVETPDPEPQDYSAFSAPNVPEGEKSRYKKNTGLLVGIIAACGGLLVLGLFIAVFVTGLNAGRQIEKEPYLEQMPDTRDGWGSEDDWESEDNWDSDDWDFGTDDDFNFGPGDDVQDDLGDFF